MEIRTPDAATTLARSLYERYNQPVYRYCMSRLRSPEEAEDAMQSTFLRAFSAMQRGVEPDYEAAWLFKIAHNVCLSRSLASARRGRVEAPADLQAMQDEIGGPVRERDELLRLDDALAEMPERLRTAFLLREWQGLSYQEIADRLEISHSAVETLIFRARKHLAHALAEPAGKAAKRVRAALESLGLSSALKGLFAGAAAKTAAVAVGLAGVTAAGLVGGTLVAAPDAPATASAGPNGAAAAAGSGSFGSLPTPALSPGLALLVGLPLDQVGWLPGPVGGVLGVQVGTTAGDVALAAGVAVAAAAGGSATGASSGLSESPFPLTQPSAPNGTTPTGSLPLVGSSPAQPSAKVPGTTFPTPVPGVTTPVPGVTTPVPGVTPPGGTPPPGGTTPPGVPTPTTPGVTVPTVTTPTVTTPTVTVPRPTVTTPTVPTPSVTVPTVTTPTVTTPSVTVPRPTVTTPTVPTPSVTVPTVPIPTVPTPSVTTPTVPPPPLPKPPPPPPPPPLPKPPPPPPVPTVPPPPPVPIPTIPPPPPVPIPTIPLPPPPPLP